jgi:hypothetical protein
MKRSTSGLIGMSFLLGFTLTSTTAFAKNIKVSDKGNKVVREERMAVRDEKKTLRQNNGLHPGNGNNNRVAKTPVVNRPAVRPQVVINRPAVRPQVVINRPAVRPQVVINRPAVRPHVVINRPAVRPQVVINRPAVRPQVVFNRPSVASAVNHGRNHSYRSYDNNHRVFENRVIVKRPARVEPSVNLIHHYPGTSCNSGCSISCDADYPSGYTVNYHTDYRPQTVTTYCPPVVTECCDIVNTGSGTSQGKVRTRNAILAAGVVNELFNQSNNSKKDIRTGAIAATLINELFHR